ncbi:hypothetical protein VE00_09169 [Pseudogymnoascus sp. WSF 3629]|nr:hypothetical protein VE00_09169 [Pseudogymnoascus sp. WSF 3629]
MSAFDWKATQFEERWFHVIACLLARTNQQQEAYAKEHLDEADEAEPDTYDSATDVEVETEITSPRNMAGSLGKKILKEKFLDRLAEVMAREMKPDKKRNDVFATGTLDFEHKTVIYLARNDGLLDIHKKMMRMIQIWLRAVASTGERRVVSKDKMWSDYETFTEFAMQFTGAKSIEFCGVEAPMLRTLESFGGAELSGKVTSAGIDWDTLNFKENRKKVKTKARKLEILKADFEKEVRVHAEIQVLMQLVDGKNDEKSGLKEFDYIGCSKKSCYLCWNLLNGFYRVRGSHGKVYPRWTISSPSLLKNWASLKLHSRVSEMGEAILKRLGSPIKRKTPYVAESTAGMTVASFTKASHRYRSHLDKERAKSERNASSKVQERLFEHEVKKIRVLRIPGDGVDPSIVKIPIRTASDAYRSRDYTARDVPDFSRFWDGQLNFDRNFHPVKVTNQEDIEIGCKVMNGQYLVYFNYSEELPPNEYLRKRLIYGIIPNERKFWNGDVFVIKLATRWTESTGLADNAKAIIKKKIEVEFDENGHAMYEDVPECILHSTMVVHLFRQFWEEGVLEELLKEDQESEQFEINNQNNKEILLSRMNETEKKVLDLLPLNFIDILAIESGDYGASRNHKIEEDSANPEKYLISFERKIDNLERINWKGFSSEQL